MVVVDYWLNGERRGMLAWRSDFAGQLVALGGFDPGPPPNDQKDQVLRTVVSTDAETRVIEGWVHPDELKEIGGREAPLRVLETELRFTVPEGTVYRSDRLFQPTWEGPSGNYRVMYFLPKEDRWQRTVRD